MLSSLRNHYLRIDARSLGIFRIAFGFLLIGDLFRRWKYLSAFYSNDGVLPNHNHLFNLIQQGRDQAFSVYHAFSSRGENHFAFFLTLIVYILFLIGYKTRIFHALSLVCLISLSARNILLENPGNYAAIAILFFALFLPCGSRFSVDSLRESMAREPEKNDGDLNRRSKEDEAQIQAQRAPGYSPTSLGALALQLQIALIFIGSAFSHHGAAWKDGSALYYALHTERFLGCVGGLFRAVPPPLLRGLSFFLYGAEWLIPALILFPVLRRPLRIAAAALIALYGLLYGSLFSFGLFGFVLIAAAPLVLNTEVWEAYCKAFKPSLARTVIYDADCGICLWIARVLKRADLRGHLAFQGNHRTDLLFVRKPDGTIESKEYPKDLKPEITNNTIVVVTADGAIHTKSRAVAAVARPVLFGWTKTIIFRIPGLSILWDKYYDAIATRRHRISELVGLGVCGVSDAMDSSGETANTEENNSNSNKVPPFTRLVRTLTGGLREAAVLVLFAAAVVQTAQANPLPISASIPPNKTLVAVATWPRMLAAWNLLAPEPPKEDGAFVVDAQTKSGRSIDLLTGLEPAGNPAARRGHNLGQLWSDFIDRIREKDNLAFQRAFRDYLGKGGLKYSPPKPDDPLFGYDTYWITTPIPAPGEAPATEDGQREKLWTHGRGGKWSADNKTPIIRPGFIKQ